MTESKYVPTKLRKLVIQRSNRICEYCRSQEDFSAESFSVEHIFPRIIGGETVEKNLAFACQGCNSHKAIKISAADPFSETDVSLFNPRSQKWNEHFAWNKTFIELIGLTPIGRATIDALKLNRKGVKNLRWALFMVGKHPPKKG